VIASLKIEGVIKREKGYCVSTLVFNLNCDFAMTFCYFAFYSNTKAPFTLICNSIAYIWVKKNWKIRKNLGKDKCAPFLYLFNCSLSPTIQPSTRLNHGRTRSAAAT
jgi:hypothetical protein